MATEITLDIGGMTVAWVRNDRGPDHGFLFQSRITMATQMLTTDLESITSRANALI